MIKRLLLLGLLAAGATGCATAMPRANNDTQERLLAVARLNERHGDVAAAEKIYQKVIEDAPGNQLALHRLGVVEAKRGRFDAGLQYLTKAATVAPPTAELLGDIGYLHYLKNELPEAEAKLRQALTIDPSSKVCLNNLGTVLAAQGRDQESLSLYKRAVGEAEAFGNLAYMQVQRGAVVEAQQNYHRALELNPQLRPAAEGLAQLAAAEQRFRARESALLAQRSEDPAPLGRQPSGASASRPALAGGSGSPDAARSVTLATNSEASPSENRSVAFQRPVGKELTAVTPGAASNPSASAESSSSAAPLLGRATRAAEEPGASSGVIQVAATEHPVEAPASRPTSGAGILRRESTATAAAASIPQVASQGSGSAKSDEPASPSSGIRSTSAPRSSAAAATPTPRVFRPAGASPTARAPDWLPSFPE